MPYEVLFLIIPGLPVLPACLPDCVKMLAGTRWNRIEAQDKHAVCFTQTQMEQFRAFMEMYRLNFPGLHYF